MITSKKTPKKYYILLISYLFFCHPAKTQTLSPEETTYKNQFEKVFSSNRVDTSKLQFLLDNLNNLNARSSDLPIIYTKKGITLAEEIKNDKWAGTLYQELGWLYQGLNQIAAAEAQYQQAITIFGAANLYALKAKAIGKLSLLYGQTNRSDQALQQAREAIKITQDLGDELGLAYAYYAIVYNFINSGKDKEALPYIEKSINLYQKYGKKYRMAVVMQNKVDCYLHLGKPNKALTAANELIDLFGNTTDTIANATDRYYLGQALYSRAKVYMKLQQYEKALLDNEVLQSLLSNGGTLLVDAVYIFQKAKILYYTQDYQASKEVSLRLLKHPTVEAERFLGYTYEYLSKNCAALKQFASAYKYRIKMEEYEEKEIFQASKLKMEELQAKYETEKNAATILAQQQAIRQQRITQWFAIGFAGILSLLLFQTYRNVVSRKQINAALRKSNNQLGESNALLGEKNKENELLLKEIHHRVKNNLEIVGSLLELQAERVTDESTQSILKDSQNRVQSMGIIHQKLYQEGNLNSVDMQDYFKNLSESILETFNAWNKMEINIDMEKLILDVELAIPIGLIVNELVTNAWKYAFPKNIFKDKKGSINISLSKPTDQQLQLIVADNGIGKTPDAPIKGTGFGSQLIHLLTLQLNGKMIEKKERGTSFIFDFQL